jgi:hypothetical protein
MKAGIGRHLLTLYDSGDPLMDIEVTMECLRAAIARVDELEVAIRFAEYGTSKEEDGNQTPKVPGT